MTIACSPDEQRRLTFIAVALGGNAGGDGAAPRVVGVGPDLADLAHDDLVDLVRRRLPSRERLADAGRAELVRVDVLERAAEAADRGAHAGHEDDGIAVAVHVPDPSGLPRPSRRATGTVAASPSAPRWTIGTDAELI